VTSDNQAEELCSKSDAEDALQLLITDIDRWVNSGSDQDLCAFLIDSGWRKA
jgi:hypothetical protein